MMLATWFLIVAIGFCTALTILGILAVRRENKLELLIVVCGLVGMLVVSWIPPNGKPQQEISWGDYPVVYATRVSKDAHPHYNLLLKQEGKTRYFVLPADRIETKPQEENQPPTLKIWIDKVGFKRTPVKKVTLMMDEIPTVTPMPSEQPLTTNQ